MKLKSIALTLAALCGIGIASAQQPHVYINPGHGGHDSDDRNVVVAPYAAGDTSGFWESNSNMWKGFALQEILRKKGYKTSISRVTNTSADDLPLSTIVALSNASGADVFYSIHSNATGAGEGYRINFPLGLYRGYTGQPQVPGSDKLASDLGVYLLANQSTVWTKNNYDLYGDWTFYPSWGLQGLGVLRGNQVVSMLDEGSFHDYIPEAYRLINRDYCWVEGWNFSLGADRYFERLDQYGLGIVTGNIRDDRLLRAATFVMHGADTRQPVNNATVRLLDANGNELQVTHTDNIENGIYLFKYVAPGTYTVEVTDEQHFGQSKQVTVTANAPTYCNFDLKRVRNTPPEVVSYAPVWTDSDLPVACNVPIVLQFNWDMDIESTEAAFEITPPVEGTFTWEDTNYRLVFNPEDAFDVNTLYTVTLRSTAQHGGGTEMGTDFSFQFNTQTRNHIEKVMLWPDEGAKPYTKSLNVEFRTDSLLQSKDLLNLFRVLDKDGNEVAWNKRGVKNNKKGDPFGYIRLPISKELNAGETYTLQIDRNVADTIGLHLAAPMNINFTPVDFATLPQGATQIADGENAAQWEVDGNYKSAALTASTTHLFGSKALQCKWDFTDTDEPTIELLPVQTLNDVVFGRGDTIGVYVWGDMSAHKLQAVFMPSANLAPGDNLEPTTVDVATINFHGWQYVCAVVPTDGQVLAALRLTPTDNRMGQSGTVVIDDVIHLKGSGNSGLNETTLADVVVAPNPATDYLIASASSPIMGVELIDLNGRVVARNAGNYINVSNIAAGNYLMRVYVNGLVSTHKVAVAK